MQGTASTLTKSEVRGGGKKPYAQKGTGNARRGSRTSPLFPGGGIIFGPKVGHSVVYLVSFLVLRCSANAACNWALGAYSLTSTSSLASAPDALSVHSPRTGASR